MANVPPWLRLLIIGLLIGVGGTGAIAFKILPVKDPQTALSPNPGNSVKPLEYLVIIVKDSETKQTLDNADIEITYEKGIIPGRTLDDGTYRLQIPPQDLGTVTILVEKTGYQQKEIPKDFSVNPNEPLTIYLESNSTKNPGTSKTSDENNTLSPSKIPSLDWDDTASEYKGRLGQDFTFNCPPGGAIAPIWGTDIYTYDSSICTAAVHSGLITAPDGGQVTIRIASGEESYQGTKRNGAESRGYGDWSGSFIFVE
jgi:hypothetical protein